MVVLEAVHLQLCGAVLAALQCTAEMLVKGTGERALLPEGSHRDEMKGQDHPGKWCGVQGLHTAKVVRVILNGVGVRQYDHGTPRHLVKTLDSPRENVLHRR